jgi:hypothetical protein
LDVAAKARRHVVGDDLKAAHRVAGVAGAVDFAIIFSSACASAQ